MCGQKKNPVFVIFSVSTQYNFELLCCNLLNILLLALATFFLGGGGGGGGVLDDWVL